MLKKDTCLLWLLLCVLAIPHLFSSCNKLSSHEKQFVGSYFIPVISETDPLIELHADGTSLIRAEIPGEVGIEVPGQWSIDNNLLVIENSPEKAEVKGNSNRIGNIARTITRQIKSYDKQTLVLIDEGLEYAYKRRRTVAD